MLGFSGGATRKLLQASREPVLAGKAVDAAELPLVVGDDGIAEHYGLSGDEQIVAADRLTGLFEAGAKQAVGGVGWRLEGQNVKRAEHRFKLSREPWRSLFRGPAPKFRGARSYKYSVPI